jgi:hypothetical protein
MTDDNFQNASNDNTERLSTRISPLVPDKDGAEDQ